MFLVSGLVMVVVALLAFTTRSYRTLSEEYERAPEPASGEGEGGAAAGSTENGTPGSTDTAADDPARADAEGSGRRR